MKRTYQIKPTFSVIYIGQGVKVHAKRDNEWGALCGAHYATRRPREHPVENTLTVNDCYKTLMSDIYMTTACKVCVRRLAHLTTTDISSIQPPI